MNNSTRNTSLLLALLLLGAAGGYYVTEIHQPAQRQRLEDMNRVARSQQGEVAQLIAEAEVSADRAETTLRKWNARYRYVPAALTTPDIVEYLEPHTSRGFEAFNIRLDGVTRTPDVSQYTFSVDGTAYYPNLYQFIWAMENEPDFYRIRELNMSRTEVQDTRRGTRRDMVRFTMELDAYFMGIEGLSVDRDELAMVPTEYLPAPEVASNSFYPKVRVYRPRAVKDDRLDVEQASLVSIAGNRAIFEDGSTQYIVYEGSEVRYGTITRIDPINVLVRASLKKDGRTQTVDVTMEATNPSFRQAEGSTQLVPIETNP
jgi:hypothetical protein